MNSTVSRRHNMRPNSGRSLPHSDVTRPAPNISSELSRQRNQDCAIDGVYKNSKFTFHLTTLIGCTVEAYVKNGKCYEGIFKTFSPDLEVVMECVHLLDPSNKDRTPTKDRVIETLIINFNDLANLTAVDADTKYGETDSFTDSAISKSQVNGVKEPRELTPFVMEAADERALEDLSSTTSGWTPEKMFKDHEEKFGQKSSFSEEQYTTKLPSADTPGFEQRKKEADRYASEIEADLSSRRNTALENGDDVDEETRFSAVARPPPAPNSSSSNKYTPPALRSNIKSTAQLSQSARHNGMPGRNNQDKHKPPASNPTEDIQKLRNWNSRFVLNKSEGPATPPTAPEQQQVAPKVDNRHGPTTGSTSPQANVVTKPVSGDKSAAAPRVTSKPDSPAANSTSPPKPASNTQSTSQSSTPSSSGAGDTATPVTAATPATASTTAAAADLTAADEPSVDKTTEVAEKSTLNPEAKEFVFSMKTTPAVAPVSAAAAAPVPQQHHNAPAQHHHYPKSKTATVSVVEARPPPTGRPDIPTPAQAMGQPIINANHQHAQYFIMPPGHGARLQRVSSYPGSEGQAGQPQYITATHPPFLPHQLVPNGMGGHGHMLPQHISGQQQHGNMAAQGPPPTHNGPLHQSMSAHGGQATHQQQGAPPPNTGTVTPVSSQHIHTPNTGYPHTGAAYIYPMSGPQSAGQQPSAQQVTQPSQPPLQPSPHNPSPSPAPPMPNGNGGPVSYPNYPPPPSQQFYQPVGPHPVSQGTPQYPANQQVVYIHPNVHSQFPHQVYHAAAAYPVPGYPQNFSAPQQQ